MLKNNEKADLIEQWKNKREDVKKDNRTFIKKQKKQKSKQLDTVADDLHETVFSELDCLDCANCCSSIPPIVNKTDSARIAKQLGMKESQFQEEYLVRDEDGDMVMKTTPCTFLLEDNTCMIYEFRPKACREYPHTDQLSFSKHFKLHASNAFYCPGVFHILERMKRLI